MYLLSAKIQKKNAFTKIFVHWHNLLAKSVYICTLFLIYTYEIMDMKDKSEKYRVAVRAVSGLLGAEHDEVASMANISAVLKDAFDFWWVGFYRLIGGVLVLGPFQGPLACTRIPLGKGVCGTAAAGAESIIVPDVDKFPGHIACSSLSRSEIVVPIIQHGRVVGVIDIDSREYDKFDHVDKENLENIAKMMAEHLTFG